MSVSISVVDQSIVTAVTLTTSSTALSEYFPDSYTITNNNGKFKTSRQSTDPSVRPPYQTDTEPPREINFKVIFHPGLHVDHSGKYGNRKVYRLNGQ
ncbi:3811_t:CDS:2, partial [Ambispora leptoticha]